MITPMPVGEHHDAEQLDVATQFLIATFADDTATAQQILRDLLTTGDPTTTGHFIAGLVRLTSEIARGWESGKPPVKPVVDLLRIRRTIAGRNVAGMHSALLQLDFRSRRGRRGGKNRT